MIVTALDLEVERDRLEEGTRDLEDEPVRPRGQIASELADASVAVSVAARDEELAPIERDPDAAHGLTARGVEDMRRERRGGHVAGC